MRTSFISIIALSFVAGSFAIPATLETRQAGICSSSLEQPLCCDVNVLGVADLDCETPPTTPTDIADFTSICASVGKIDMCCILPILEQGLICTSP